MKPSATTEAEPGGVVAAPRRRALIRTCVGCRQSGGKADFLRVVCGPTGHLMLDPQGKLPGRGASICLRRACLARALQGRLLREALRQEVVCAPLEEFVQGVIKALEARAIAGIHLARKAGRAVSGYTQVMRALAHEPVTLLLLAEDTAPERLREYRLRCERRRIPSHSFLVKTRLGALVGRDESSAIGILDRCLSERLRWYLEGMSRLTER